MTGDVVFVGMGVLAIGMCLYGYLFFKKAASGGYFHEVD